MARLAALLDRMVDYGDLPCIHECQGQYSYKQTLEACERFDRTLDECDVRAGCVIGLQADYSLASVALLLAALRRRCIVTLVPRVRDPSVYLADALVEQLFTIEVETGQLHRRVVARPREHGLLAALRRSNQGGIVLFTSGSTGRPKAALQSTERLLSKFSSPGRRFCTLAFLMFDHIAGMDTLFYTLSSGGSLVVATQRNPDAVRTLIESHRVEVLPVSPSFLRLMCFGQSANRCDLSSLKIITYGSEPMDPTTLRLVNEHFPGIQITQKYGTTETGSPKAISRGNDSLWMKLAPPGRNGGLEMKVLEGVLWLRGESTILGYLNAPSPLDEDGWYCTGDLVEVEGEWLRFAGRATEIINVGGEKVVPSEVEHVILELPFVRDAIVQAESNLILGQIVTARARIDEAHDIRNAIAVIRRHCGERLARYKVPVRIDVVTHEIVGARQKRVRQALPAVQPVPARSPPSAQ